MAAGQAVVMVSRATAVGGPMTVSIDCDGGVDCTDEASREENGARGVIAMADGTLTTPSGSATIVAEASVTSSAIYNAYLTNLGACLLWSTGYVLPIRLLCPCFWAP
jgi:hypothetical protein